MLKLLHNRMALQVGEQVLYEAILKDKTFEPIDILEVSSEVDGSGVATVQELIALPYEANNNHGLMEKPSKSDATVDTVKIPEMQIAIVNEAHKKATVVEKCSKSVATVDNCNMPMTQIVENVAMKQLNTIDRAQYDFKKATFHNCTFTLQGEK